jgi:S-formylglutathione hydrolase FrmB
MSFRVFAALTFCVAIGFSGSALAQVETNLPPLVPGAPTVTVEHIKVHSAALEGNLEGEPADRDVLVFLPPSYAADPARRYPVVYALHGFWIGAEQWTHEIHAPQTIEGAYGKGAREMIIVFPDSKTVYGGSMYSQSPTAGDFEDFVAHDLVAYIDAHYRTIPARESRGLVGHSMGGYGATRIGMKHPDVFGSLYIMSPCCIAPRIAAPKNGTAFMVPDDPKNDAAIAAMKSPADVANLPFQLHPMLASAAAWSPDPKKPPLYLDLPIGDDKDAVLAKWTANAPLAFIDQYIQNLRRYRAIGIDVGDQDGLKTDTVTLHEALDSYGIANSFEIFPGTHTSNVAFRFQDHVLPFFSKNLSFQAP